MKRIFVTGGTGSIGRAVVHRLEKRLNTEVYVLSRQKIIDCYNIHYVHGDIKDTNRLKSILHELLPDTLMHFAWDVSSNPYFSDEQYRWIDWSEHLAKTFLESGGKHIIASGTCFEYDISSLLPHKEDEKCLPKTTYGRSKLETLRCFENLCKSYKAKLIWGRIFYAYGKGEREKKLFSSLIQTLKCGEKIICRTPDDFLDFISISDVAKIFVSFLSYDDVQGVYNIGTGTGMKVGNIAKQIAKQLNSMELLDFGQGGEQGKKIIADISKLRTVYKESFCNMDEAVNELIDNLSMQNN